MICVQTLQEHIARPASRRELPSRDGPPSVDTVKGDAVDVIWHGGRGLFVASGRDLRLAFRESWKTGERESRTAEGIYLQES